MADFSSSLTSNTLKSFVITSKSFTFLLRFNTLSSPPAFLTVVYPLTSSPQPHAVDVTHAFEVQENLLVTGCQSVLNGAAQLTASLTHGDLSAKVQHRNAFMPNLGVHPNRSPLSSCPLSR